MDGVSLIERAAVALEQESGKWCDAKAATDRAECLIALARELRESVAWQPIETAPKDGSLILVFTVDLNRHAAYWHSTHWLLSDGSKLWDEPTNWRPLPEAPHDRSWGR